MTTSLRRLSIGAGVLVAAILASAYLGTRLSDRPKAVSEAAGPKAAPAQTMDSLKLEGVGANGARWVLTAMNAQADSTGELGFMNTVHFEHFAKTGVSKGDAERAERRKAGEGYLLTGGVSAEWGEWVARTPSALYDPARGLMTGDSEVTVTSGDIILTGRGFTADMNESRGKILSASHAILKGVN